MIRVAGFAFGIAILASIASNGNRAVIWAAFIGAVAVVVVPLLKGQTALRCPACRKRVKLGASACHHCGRTVAR